MAVVVVKGTFLEVQVGRSESVDSSAHWQEPIVRSATTSALRHAGDVGEPVFLEEGAGWRRALGDGEGAAARRASRSAMIDSFLGIEEPEAAAEVVRQDVDLAGCSEAHAGSKDVLAELWLPCPKSTSAASLNDGRARLDSDPCSISTFASSCGDSRSRLASGSGSDGMEEADVEGLCPAPSASCAPAPAPRLLGAEAKRRRAKKKKGASGAKGARSGADQETPADSWQSPATAAAPGFAGCCFGGQAAVAAIALGCFPKGAAAHAPTHWPLAPAPRLVRLADAIPMSSQQQQQPQQPQQGSAKSAGIRTSMILRNLPNRYTRDMLCDVLDQMGFAGRYDFVYLPVDFNTKVGLGFCFVNLLSPADAELLLERLDGFKTWRIPSAKVLRVGWSSAEQQGLQANIERYRNSSVMHESVPEEYRPLLLVAGSPVAFPAPTRKVWPPHESFGCRVAK